MGADEKQPMSGGHTVKLASIAANLGLKLPARAKMVTV
jgi:hypothetical protein